MNVLPFSVERRLRGLKFRLTRKLPVRQPTDVWPGIDSSAVTLRPFAGQFGNVQRYELMVLCAVARHTQAKAIFEASGASDKTYVELPRVTHYLTGHRREAIDLIVDWLRARVP